MPKIFKIIKENFVEALPATIFFFIAFHLIALTEILLLRQYQIPVSTTAVITVSAPILAKAILLADKLPFINRFPNKPLIYNILWKTTIYVLIALVFRYLQTMIPMLLKHQSWSVANEHLQREIIWPHFWAVQIWVCVLFMFYSIIRELVRTRGKREVLRMFFGV